MKIRRALRFPAIALVVYFGLYLLFVVQTAHQGLLSPSGDVSWGLLALGATVLLLRLFVLFVLPGLIVYRLLRAL